MLDSSDSENLKNQNAHNHHLPAGHQPQDGGVRLHGLTAGRNGTRTGGKTTNGQTNGQEGRRRMYALIAAGNSMRKRQVQRCRRQLLKPAGFFSLVPFFLLQNLLNLAVSEPACSNKRECDGVCGYRTNLSRILRTLLEHSKRNAKS